MTAEGIIAGVDEAGRGALAGPVVAGACVLSRPLIRRRGEARAWSPFPRVPAAGDCLIADSKQLSPEQRERAFAWITQHCAYGFGIVGADVIEERGILAATERAMHEAVAMLSSKIDVGRLLVDGRDRFRFMIPHRSIIRGDSLEPCIAAASIVAKVTRDRLMVERCAEYPGYHFSQHKGYGTEEHRRAIERLGPCDIHRKTFLTRVHQPELLAA